jgi:hypothetical protein
MAVLNQNLNRAFVLSELAPANEISFLDSYKKTLSKCCNDPLRPPRLSGLGHQNPRWARCAGKFVVPSVGEAYDARVELEIHIGNPE